MWKVAYKTSFGITVLFLYFQIWNMFEFFFAQIFVIDWLISYLYYVYVLIILSIYKRLQGASNLYISCI